MQPSETTEKEGPPRPALVLRFGISGHRTLGEEAGLRVHKVLTALFTDARDTLGHLQSGHHQTFCGNAAALRLISPLAEGSDRLAAQAALDCGFALDCPLPFARELYEADFKAEASRKAFHQLLARAKNVFELEETRGVDDTRAYEAVGLMTLRQCDILIAVWNGLPAEGRGGTAEIVSHAIESNIPVIWIHSDNKDAPPKLLRPEPLGSRDPLQMPSEELSAEVLRDLLCTMVLPPHDPSKRVHRPPSKRLRAYWDERQTKFTFSVFYALLQMMLFVRWPRLADLRVPNYLVSANTQWRTYWQLLPPISGPSREKLATVLEPAFGWADGLASYYVRVYRSSYVLSFALAAGAVFVSLLGLWHGVAHKWLIVIELIMMWSVVVIVWNGMTRSWHDRWIDYRHLAELLRHMRVLTLTGSSTFEIRDTIHSEESSGDSGAAWVNWYYRAVVRDIGMVGVRADPAYAVAVAQLVQKTELREQVLYHRGVGEVSQKLDHRLDRWGVILFGLTAAVCTVFTGGIFFLHWKFENYGTAEIFFTALLPALGAAFYGIRVQGEFGRIAQRARHMDEQLSQVSAALRNDLAKGAMTLSRVSSLTESATHAMALDVTDWRFVFREKPLTLPT